MLALEHDDPQRAAGALEVVGGPQAGEARRRRSRRRPRSARRAARGAAPGPPSELHQWPSSPLRMPYYRRGTGRARPPPAEQGERDREVPPMEAAVKQSGAGPAAPPASAATLAEAFRITAARARRARSRSARRATPSRSPGASCASASTRSPAAWPSSASARGETRRADALQPARVPPLRPRGDDARRDAVLDLQHLLPRADRLPASTTPRRRSLICEQQYLPQVLEARGGCAGAAST